MKYKDWIKLLFVGIVLLLVIDILTGIWYWNRLNLEFSLVEFNNIFIQLARICDA